jgi:hypothetical protein
VCDTSGVNPELHNEEQQGKASRKDVKVVMVSYKELSYDECCNLVGNRNVCRSALCMVRLNKPSKISARSRLHLPVGFLPDLL